MEHQILAALLLICGLFTLFGVSGQLLLHVWRLLLWVLRSPFALASWLFARRAAGRRKKNYEVLASYMPVIGDNPRLIQYVEHLIEDGIHPERLQAALHRNAKVGEVVDFRRRMREMMLETEKAATLAELETHHQAVLAESQARLERLRFKERVLGGLFRKIRNKYRV